MPPRKAAAAALSATRFLAWHCTALGLEDHELARVLHNDLSTALRPARQPLVGLAEKWLGISPRRVRWRPRAGGDPEQRGSQKAWAPPMFFAFEDAATGRASAVLGLMFKTRARPSAGLFIGRPPVSIRKQPPQAALTRGNIAS